MNSRFIEAFSRPDYWPCVIREATAWDQHHKQILICTRQAYLCCLSYHHTGPSRDPLTTSLLKLNPVVIDRSLCTTQSDHRSDLNCVLARRPD